MTNIWTRPHHVIIEVENKNCSVLRKCASLGLDDLKVTDIRASNSGSIKHLIELKNHVRKGVRCIILYVIQRTDCNKFKVAKDLDQEYYNASKEAAEKGVEFLAFNCFLTKQEITLQTQVEIL